MEFSNFAHKRKGTLFRFNSKKKTFGRYVMILNIQQELKKSKFNVPREASPLAKHSCTSINKLSKTLTTIYMSFQFCFQFKARYVMIDFKLSTQYFFNLMNSDTSLLSNDVAINSMNSPLKTFSYR